MTLFQPKKYMLDLNITKECTNVCPFCYNAAIDYNDMSINDVYSAMEKSVPFNVKEVHIAGGEPFEHPKIREILKICKQYGMRTVVFSSLVRDIYDFLPLIDELRVSRNGFSDVESSSVFGRKVVNRHRILQYCDITNIRFCTVHRKSGVNSAETAFRFVDYYNRASNMDSILIEYKILSSTIDAPENDFISFDLPRGIVRNEHRSAGETIYAVGDKVFRTYVQL